MDRIKIALAQMESEPGDQPSNLRKMLGYVKRAAGEGARLVIFPEMCLPGYMVMDGRDFKEFFQLASDFRDEAAQALQQAAADNNINVIYGAATRSREITGIFYNSAVLLKPDGSFNPYHKTHAPTGNKGGTIFYEGLYFKPGSEFPVFAIDGAKIGMQVCYDLFFPEVSRILAIKGAELIIIISASPATSRAAFETMFAARALENTCFIVYVNTVGLQRGVNFFGGSRVMSPAGAELSKLSYEKEDFGMVELDPGMLESVRQRLFHLRDRARRPEIYKELCDDFG